MKLLCTVMYLMYLLCGTISVYEVSINNIGGVAVFSLLTGIFAGLLPQTFKEK